MQVFSHVIDDMSAAAGLFSNKVRLRRERDYGYWEGKSRIWKGKADNRKRNQWEGKVKLGITNIILFIHLFACLLIFCLLICFIYCFGQLIYFS
jgi:hypothetical protein